MPSFGLLQSPQVRDGRWLLFVVVWKTVAQPLGLLRVFVSLPSGLSEDHQGAITTLASAGQVAKHAEDAPKVAEGYCHLGMIGAVGCLLDRQDTLKLVTGTGQVPATDQYDAEVGEDPRHLRVVRAVSRFDECQEIGRASCRERV